MNTLQYSSNLAISPLQTIAHANLRVVKMVVHVLFL